MEDILAGGHFGRRTLGEKWVCQKFGWALIRIMGVALFWVCRIWNHHMVHCHVL